MKPRPTKNDTGVRIQLYPATIRLPTGFFQYFPYNIHNNNIDIKMWDRLDLNMNLYPLFPNYVFQIKFDFVNTFCM